MKIAVLFGSFNPFTNAHLTIMKTAVKHLNADKGLFVATNGQYLRKKTIKINDPFYLSETERQGIIEQICQAEPQLEFWGFEMGGAIPRRYLTLCKIQSQYPDAEFYEIQGADKVHSIAKFTKAEDYLSHIRFAVFARNGIDLDQVIGNEPILTRYKSSFTLLPALGDCASVSSTEVRRRFNAGEDYSDLIPPAAAQIVARYKPTDFTITYADRMKTIISSGRFGLNQACKTVYNENTELFKGWKEGTNEIDFGNYQEYLDSTKLYDTAYTVADLGTTYPSTQVGCINTDCVDLAEHLLAQGYNPAILNLASAGRPGGGYDRGKKAQEESLCHASTLSLSLYQYADPRKLKCVRECGVPLRRIAYPLDTNFGGLYTPNVTFFRNNKSKYFTLKDKPFNCDVITVAALSFNGRNDFARACELLYRAADGGFTPEGEAIMLNKIRTIFRMGIEHGKDSLILGAFGCGAYRLPSDAVAKLFRVVMEEPEFKNKFRLITFAILESTHKPNGLRGKFAPFYHEFGTYTIK